MHRLVSEALADGVDLLYVDHLQMFQYVPKSSPCPVLLDEHNVEWRIIERFASSGSSLSQRLFARLEWPKLRAFELSACKRADAVLTVTEDDKATLVDNGVPVSKVSAVPIGVDVEIFQPVSLGDLRLVTFGTMSWPPNIDAILYFCKEIYPRIKERVHGVTFSIIGANPPPEIRALADDSIEVTGFVPDIAAAVKGAAAFVVPLRIGSGMRVKILDAMALGLPIVSTSVGCEGITARHDEHLLVADTPEAFAHSVERLLICPTERTRLAEAGRALVERRYSWPPILSRLDECILRM